MENKMAAMSREKGSAVMLNMALGLIHCTVKPAEMRNSSFETCHAKPVNLLCLLSKIHNNGGVVTRSHKDILRNKMKGTFLLKPDAMIFISQPESPLIYTLASTYCLNKYIISAIW